MARTLDAPREPGPEYLRWLADWIEGGANVDSFGAVHIPSWLAPKIVEKLRASAEHTE